jgi:hypothetical protein
MSSRVSTEYSEHDVTKVRSYIIGVEKELSPMGTGGDSGFDSYVYAYLGLAMGIHLNRYGRLCRQYDTTGSHVSPAPFDAP